MKKLVSAREALESPNYFGGVMGGESWLPWRTLLIAFLGEPLTDDERVIYESLTGRPAEPGEAAREFWGVIGRRGGKSRAIAALGVYLAAFCDHRHILAPGEVATLPILSASVSQAQTIFNYTSGLFEAVQAIGQLVTRRTADTIGLSSGVEIAVRPASFRTIRGSSMIAAIGDEIAFWRSDEASRNPDGEILAAIRPALITSRGPLICISSPYSRRGELYRAWKDHFGPNGDSDIIVAKASSQAMNCTLPQADIDREYRRDPASADAEFGGNFRTDVEAFITREAIEGCIALGVLERAPLPNVEYTGFVDPSGGSSDAMTLAIAHREDDVSILDAVRERKPPFSPEAVVSEFAELLKLYRIATIRGDRYAGEWPREAFRKQGVNYIPADKTRSELYLALLPPINSRRIELLDDKKMVTQFISLERRTARSGKDSIDHAPGAHDDLANAVAGALVGAGFQAPQIPICAPIIIANPNHWIAEARAHADPRSEGFSIGRLD